MKSQVALEKVSMIVLTVIYAMRRGFVIMRTVSKSVVAAANGVLQSATNMSVRVALRLPCLHTFVMDAREKAGVRLKRLATGLLLLSGKQQTYYELPEKALTCVWQNERGLMLS
jgi:hypothetical protein